MAETYFSPLDIQPGTQPGADNTSFGTWHWTRTQNVYFKGKDGKTPRLAKVPGWQSSSALTGGLVGFIGACRSIFSYIFNRKLTAFGTSHRLYVLRNGELLNLTPLSGSTTAIADSLDTNYGTLGSNPITTVSGSKRITIAHTAHRIYAGDSITISGCSGNPGGIPDAQINTTHTVKTVPDANSYTVDVATTAATSSTSGGGGSVVEATPIITVNATAHGLVEGDRVAIADAATTGGIADTQINAEHIIRNIDTNEFDIVVASKATSAVTGGGGSSTTFEPPISSGDIDRSLGVGYGGGKYGVGLYGVPKTFSNVYTLPQIWSFARFGNNLLCCPGNGGKIYAWDGDVDVAPTVLSNSPTNSDWIAVSNNAVISVYGNAVRVSEVGDATVWTPGTTTTAYTDTVEGLGDIITIAQAGTINLLFTENLVATFAYVGLPDLWLADYLLKNDGIIGPKARIEIDGKVYWMGAKDFYFTNGGDVEKCPGNTCHEYIYANLNKEQAYKTFIRPDTENDQFYVYFPTGSSLEPNEYVIVNYKRWDWTLGTQERTASEEPVTANAAFIYLTEGVETASDNSIYKHGRDWVDADGSAMQAYAETNYKWLQDGKRAMSVKKVIPDSIQTGDIVLTTSMKQYPQGAVGQTRSDTIESGTDFVSPNVGGRLRSYRIESNVIGGEFQMGNWVEELQPGGTV